MVSAVASHYPDTLQLSDLNVKSLVGEILPLIRARAVKTLILPELEKIYERNPMTASNLEGHLQALVAEGFHAASFQKQQLARLEARCVVIGAMTDDVRDRHAQAWQDTGFSRRFLWPLFTLSDRSTAILRQSVIREKLLNFGEMRYPPMPISGTIQNATTEKEREAVERLLNDQPGPHTAQHHMLVRTLAVLKWWYRELGYADKEALYTLQRFGVLLGRNGGQLALPPMPV